MANERGVLPSVMRGSLKQSMTRVGRKASIGRQPIFDVTIEGTKLDTNKCNEGEMKKERDANDSKFNLKRLDFKKLQLYQKQRGERASVENEESTYTNLKALQFKKKFNIWRRQYSSKVSNDNQISKQLQNELMYRLIDIFIENGIKILATDFDLTMTTVHTGGEVYTFQPRFEDIGHCLSKEFDVFATKIQEKGITIVVVTHADASDSEEREDVMIGGRRLVKHVLNESGAHFNVAAIYDYCPPKWCDAERYHTLGLTAPMKPFKEYHLMRVSNEFNVQYNEILLLDDDLNNVKSAIKKGCMGLHVRGNLGFDLSTLRVPSI